MVRPPALPPEEKVRIVLSILAGEMTVAEAARRAKVSEQSIGTWKRQFLESGRASHGDKSGPSTREQQFEARVADLTQALGEAAVELRVWKKSGGPAGPFEDLEVIRTERACRPRGSAGSSACPSGPGAVTRPAPAGARMPEDRGRARPARASRRPPAGTRSRTWPGATARCGRCAATTATASPRRPCCGCCGTRACCWRRTTSGNGASSPQGRLLDRAHRPEPGLAARLLRVRDRLGRRGTWRLAGCRDYWSKYELGWHVSSTANQHDAIGAIELAIKDAELLAGKPLAELAPRDADGTVKLLVTIFTDNGGPFRSFRSEAFIATRPELRHVRTRVRTPRQNGSRERGFGSPKCEKLFLEEIPDALDLVRHAEYYRRDYNTVRPHEALGLEPAPRCPYRRRGPARPQLSRTRKPANCLTRDKNTRNPRQPQRLNHQLRDSLERIRTQAR